MHLTVRVKNTCMRFDEIINYAFCQLYLTPNVTDMKEK